MEPGPGILQQNQIQRMRRKRVDRESAVAIAREAQVMNCDMKRQKISDSAFCYATYSWGALFARPAVKNLYPYPLPISD